jgi:predicted ATPase
VTQLPSGTVTFLFTDVEGSTRLWERAAGVMARALARHDELLRYAFDRHGGHVFATGGDGFAVAFSKCSDAIAAAVDAQRALEAESWPPECPVRVRMGLHIGEADERGGDFFGPAVNLSARLMGAAHGGQIVCSAAVADIMGRDPNLVDLGEHRFRDVESPLHVWQVCPDGFVCLFPPLRSVNNVGTNLPRELSSFVGRQEEVAALRDTVAAARVVSIVGVGGVGKSRVARRVGWDLVSRFPDGVWMSELAPVREPTAVAEAVVAALQIAVSQGMTVRSALFEYLAGKRLLLILDNCEHVIAETSALVGDLAAASDQLHVLATSREPLAIVGERVVGIAPLSLPCSSELPDVLASDAAALFVARASDARPGFVVDETNAAVIAQLCVRLDGIPLALELAAARTTTIDPREIVSRFDRILPVLGGAGRGRLERHQTLRAAIDWSYDLLGETERALLHQLSTFVGGFDLDALVSVAAPLGIDELTAVDVLSGLVTKSLVARDDDRFGRYRMLETIREYADDRLVSSGDASLAHSRHADFFLGFARQQIVRLRGPSCYDAIERLAADAENVGAAGAWLVSTDHTTACLELFTLVPTPMLGVLPTPVTDALSTIINAATSVPNAAQLPGFTAACSCGATFALFAGDLAAIDRFLALVAPAPQDEHAAIARTVACTPRGDMDGAIANIEAALDTLAADGDPLQRAQCLGMLGLCEAAVGAPGAPGHARQGADLARQHGGPLGQLGPLVSLTAVLAMQDPNAARGIAKEIADLDRTSRRINANLAAALAAAPSGVQTDLAAVLEELHTSLQQLHAANARGHIVWGLGGLADAIADSEPETALSLAYLAESPAFSSTSILTTPGYPRLHHAAGTIDAQTASRLRTHYTSMSYDDAMAFVFTTIERLSLA